MISSKDILEATGIKNTKTLTRWAKRGIIPDPIVRTHPSGRGKLGYWPDWVLDHCQRIMQQKNTGMSLDQAVIAADDENMEAVKSQFAKINIKKTPNNNHNAEKSIRKSVEQMRQNLHLRVFQRVLAKSINRSIYHEEAAKSIALKAMENNVVEKAVEFAKAGYNPIFIFDGKTSFVTSDVNIAHYLSKNTSSSNALVIVPLLSLIGPAWKKLNPESELEIYNFPDDSRKVLSEEGESKSMSYSYVELEIWEEQWDPETTTNSNQDGSVEENDE